MSELITQPANVFDVNIGTLRVTRGQNIIRVNDNVLTCTGDAVSAVEQIITLPLYLEGEF